MYPSALRSATCLRLQDPTRSVIDYDDDFVEALDAPLEVHVSDPWALARYLVISAYIAAPPPRGRCRAVLEQLASRSWPGPTGEPFTVSAETIRVWVRRYRIGGLDALADALRPSRGVTVLTEDEVAKLCALKLQVPERSLDRLIRVAEDLELLQPGKARRSTVHRVLVAHAISGRRLKKPDTEDLDRYQADYPNEIWQSDMLEGPWMPDPERPGKVRKSWLYTFLDDCSRYCPYGRFAFKGDLPALELVFRRSVQKCGVPTRVYFDNGAVYRSHHIAHIVARLGIVGIVFTKPRRPMGHGKIEAFNRLINSAFIAEVKASNITTLDQLNEAWVAWVDAYYNVETHTETLERPVDRWRAHLPKVQFVDEARIRAAFLWSEIRTADKAGIFSLFGTEYQVSAAFARKALEVRYDPEQLDEVEIWVNKKCVERVKPFAVRRHRRARTEAPAPETPAFALPSGGWLGKLVTNRRDQDFIEPTPQMLAEAETQRRAEADAAVFDVFADRLDPDVVDAPTIRTFLARFGPWDADAVATALDQILTHQPRDLHAQVYLDLVHTQLKGGPS